MHLVLYDQNIPLKLITLMFFVNLSNKFKVLILSLLNWYNYLHIS